jgi:hypothetical protein
MPSQEQRSSAPPTLAAAAPTRGEDQSRSAASVPAPMLPAANLGPVVSSSIIIPSSSSPEPSPDARLAASPSETGSNSISPAAFISERPSTVSEPAPLAMRAPSPAAPPRPSVPSAVPTEANLVTAPEQSGSLVDLNTASLKQLNTLRGGGLIGRAIIGARPYATTEDLVRKRVLSRSAFARVKDQVTVR